MVYLIVVVSITQARLKDRVTKVLQVVDKIPDRLWIIERVCEWGAEMGLFNLMGTGGREIQKHTAMELLDIVTTAIIGALYIDGGTESVTCVLGGYVDYMAKRRRSSL